MLVVASKYVSGSGIIFQKFWTQMVRERVNQRIHCDIKNLSEKTLLELYISFSSIDDDYWFTGWLNVYEGGWLIWCGCMQNNLVQIV